MGRNRKTGILNLMSNLKGTNANTYKANVINYIEGDSTLKREFKNVPQPRGRSTTKIGIIPFWAMQGTPGTDFEKYTISASMTHQAGDVAKTLPAVSSKSMYETCGIEFDLTKVKGVKPTGFYPAIARISLTAVAGGATTYIDATKISSITGRPYKLPKRRSGTIPFGRSLNITQATQTAPVIVTSISEADYGEVREAIRNHVTAFNGVATPAMLASVSFEGEVVRILQKEGKAAATASSFTAISAL